MFQRLVLLLLFATAALAADLKPEELVARHLDSIGTPRARAAAKSRLAQGTASMKIIVGGAGKLQGDALLVSLGRKLNVTMRFAARDYPGEQFVVDGQRFTVATTGPNTRSALGDFLFRHDRILKDGLLGGAMSTSWVLLDLSAAKPQLKYQGLKKIGDRQLHELSYTPRKGEPELEIHLYFQPETFRHVLTVYTFTVPPYMMHKQTEHADTVRYRLEERFSDFRVVDGLTLPQHWRLQYAVEPAQASVLEWEVNITRMVNNVVTD